MGGSIYYGCLYYEGFDCNLTLKNNNVFIENNASDEGGSISWTNIKYFDDKSTVFINNTAFYGNDVSSYAKSLIITFITNNDVSTTNLRLLNDSSTE